MNGYAPVFIILKKCNKKKHLKGFLSGLWHCQGIIFIKKGGGGVVSNGYHT